MYEIHFQRNNEDIEASDQYVEDSRYENNSLATISNNYECTRL